MRCSARKKTSNYLHDHSCISLLRASHPAVFHSHRCTHLGHFHPALARFTYQPATRRLLAGTCDGPIAVAMLRDDSSRPPNCHDSERRTDGGTADMRAEDRRQADRSPQSRSLARRGMLKLDRLAECRLHEAPHRARSAGSCEPSAVWILVETSKYSRITLPSSGRLGFVSVSWSLR